MPTDQRTYQDDQPRCAPGDAASADPERCGLLAQLGTNRGGQASEDADAWLRSRGGSRGDQRGRRRDADKDDRQRPFVHADREHGGSPAAPGRHDCRAVHRPGCRARHRRGWVPVVGAELGAAGLRSFIDQHGRHPGPDRGRRDPDRDARTGRDSGSMAAQLAALELVLADGSIVTCSADDPQPDLFNACRIGLGALGIVTAVTFRTEPQFLLTAREEPMSWSEVISRLRELTSVNEHFEFYWFPHSEGCLTKRNNRSTGPARPLPGWRYWLDDEFLSNSMFGAACHLGHLAPSAIPTVN